MNLSGRVTFITGGARGIGRGCALELARRGADIAVCDLALSGAAEETVYEVRSLGRQIEFFEADVADRAGVDRAIAATVMRLGRLDILVNNAALTVRKPLLELETADVARVWGAILWGTFHCTQVAARQMVRQGEGGNIVMISSVLAEKPFPTSSLYNGAKAGVNQMARTWAAELAPHGIRVNVIEPGWIDTPGERAFATEAEIEERGGKLPLGRLGTAEEIGKTVAYLVSAEASYVTGACLRVDGGIMLPH
ncbi:MAG: SDR family NAD(P)-dependent oxidoreductase [Bryobacteraceae bacterium]